MEKGLCSTCIHDEKCSFSRTFPVSQCEEFSGYEPKINKKEKGKTEQDQDFMKSQ